MRLAPRPVPVLPGASLHLWRWDIVETDTQRPACSLIYDDRLSTEAEIWRRARAVEEFINEGAGA